MPAVEVPTTQTTGTEPDTAAAVSGDAHGGDTGDGPAPDIEDQESTEGAVVDAGAGCDTTRAAGSDTAGSAVAPRIESGEYTCRYAGVMLAHAYLHRPVLLPWNVGKSPRL